MKSQILKAIVLTIALSAAAQSIHRAYAQTEAVARYRTQSSQQTVFELLYKKQVLESQGLDLNPSETKILIDSMKKSYEHLEQQFPGLIQRTESPTV